MMKVKKKNGKPFKSGLKIGTVTGLIDHPILLEKKGEKVPAYTFAEDDSFVAISQCVAVEGIP